MAKSCLNGQKGSGEDWRREMEKKTHTHHNVARWQMSSWNWFFSSLFPMAMHLKWNEIQLIRDQWPLSVCMSYKALPSIMKFTMIRHSTEPWTVSLDNEWEERDSTRGVMEIQLSARCTYAMLEWWIYKRIRSMMQIIKSCWVYMSTRVREWKTPDCIIFRSSSCSSATQHIDLSAVMYMYMWKLEKRDKKN